MYVSKQRLKELVEDAQQTGKPSDELAINIDAIGLGVWKWKGQLSGIEEEDFRQAFVLHVLTHLDRIDPDRNIFSYLTRMAIRVLQVAIRNNKTHNAKLQAYWKKQQP